MKPTVGNAGISLRQRLLMLTLLTSGIGLLVGCGAILIFDLHNAKSKTVRDLRLTADLIGTNTAAALAFDDAMNGEKLLDALRTRPHIRGAALYESSGRFLASYLRADLKGQYLFPQELPGKILIESDLLELER